jgi:transposase
MEEMPAKIYRVTLTEEERTQLKALTSKGKGAARRLTHARILLLADQTQDEGAWKDADIAQALGIHARTVERVRERCVEEGVEAALNHKQPRKKRSKVLDGAAEARLTQLACTEAPDGHERWSMQMLADKLIELEVVETVSRETVRTTLKKMNLSLG